MRLASLEDGSLPKCREWNTWLGWWWDRMGDETQGWSKFLRDATVVLHHMILNAARRLRGNPGWDMAGTMRDDTVNLESEARANLAQFEKDKPRPGDIPVRFVPILDALEGAFRQQVRIARELEENRATGSLYVDADNEARAIARRAAASNIVIPGH